MKTLDFILNNTSLLINGTNNSRTLDNEHYCKLYKYTKVFHKYEILEI